MDELCNTRRALIARAEAAEADVPMYRTLIALLPYAVHLHPAAIPRPRQPLAAEVRGRRPRARPTERGHL